MKSFRRLAGTGLSLIPFTAIALLAADPTPPDTPVAKIGDTVLTEGQMRSDMGMELFEAQNQLYQTEKRWIDQKAKNVLFDQAAKDAGMSRSDWQAKEITQKITPPPMEEVQKIAKQMAQSRGAATNPNDASAIIQFEQQANQYLMQQRTMTRENEVYNELQKKYPVQVLLPKPVAPRMDVPISPDDPSMGPKDAPITIIEFTDFQCPYCKRSQETLKQVEEAYKGKIRLVEKQYPLPFHNRAKPSAEAALCAKEQGKFWEMHDKLFPSNALEDSDIARFAKEIGLNQKKFDQCLKDHRYAARIDQDIAEGQKFGVRGTPMFFVNGIPLSGAQPFDAFKSIIDDQLASQKK